MSHTVHPSFIRLDSWTRNLLTANKIYRRTMKLLPSTALYLCDGAPVAWAFLGTCYFSTTQLWLDRR